MENIEEKNKEKAFKMWDTSVVFYDGVYYYTDGSAAASVISSMRAREHEVDYYSYLADMDMGRGNMPPEAAYPFRGFSRSKTGWWEYSRSYEVDAIREGQEAYVYELDYIIPEKVGNKQINVIEYRAFLNCAGLTGITIPDSIIDIGEEAFAGCTHLYKLSLPDSITHIGKKAFDDTWFYQNEFNWEDGALYIDKWLIKVKTDVTGCFKLKEGTVGVADYAFGGCEYIEYIEMPESVDYIGNCAFKGCKALKNIHFPSEVKGMGCETSNPMCVIPVIGLSRADYVFADNISLTKVAIPKGVTEIGRGTFRGCVNLKEITVPNSVRIVHPNSFEGAACEALMTQTYVRK